MGFTAFLSTCSIFFVHYLLPESPHYLISVQKYDEANQMFRRMANVNGKTCDSKEEFIVGNTISSVTVTEVKEVKSTG